MNIYGITVFIQEECLLKAARAFLVFKAVEDYGNIIAYNPSSQDIEDEKFGIDFSFYLVSEEGLEKILEVSRAVSEIEEVVGEKLKYSELTAAAEKKKQLRRQSRKQKQQRQRQKRKRFRRRQPRQNRLRQQQRRRMAANQ